MVIRVALIVVCFQGALCAVETCVMTNGVNPWTDREFTVDGLTGPLDLKQTVPKQKFNSRTLRVPAGAKNALIGVWQGASSRYVRLLGLKRTGLKARLARPDGGTALNYDVMIYDNPAPAMFFEHGGAGILLIALDVDLPTMSTKKDTRVYKGLAKEQEFEGQPWPLKPGKRLVKVYVREPSRGVDADTGFMLLSHNWGGKHTQVASWCNACADRYNVIAVSVNYLQSGEPKVTEGIPYDHGYLQAMDCLRALYHVQQQLTKAKAAFSARRFYAAGASGGGNVTLMVNKFAPHTFACVMDLCGMPGLTDDIAFGKGGLNAGYSKDPNSRAYLTQDMQEIRDPGHPQHLAVQHRANRANKVIIVHGLDDRYCAAVDKTAIYKNMLAAGFRPDGHFLTKWHLGRGGIESTGHRIGSRLKVIQHYGDDYFTPYPAGRLAAETKGKNDFEAKGQVIYPTTNGKYTIDYANGPPTISFSKTDK
jgi:predicted esterase